MEPTSGRIKVIQYGLGVLGQHVVRILSRKEGIEVVGALDIDKGKVGLDVGDVAGLGMELGVSVSDNPVKLFADTPADVVIHTVCSTLIDAYPQIQLPIRQGINVVSSAEELCNPNAADPFLADELDRLATSNGVTVVGTGVRPGFLGDYFTLVATGICDRIDMIQSWTHLNLSSSNLAPQVSRRFGIGLTSDQFKLATRDGTIIEPIGVTDQIALLADRLGWVLDEITSTFEPIVSNGVVAGYEMWARGMREGESRIVVEHRGVVDSKEETSEGLTIKGRPNLNIVLQPGITGYEATAARCVNVLPHALSGRPGVMTSADLPLVWALPDRWTLNERE